MDFAFLPPEINSGRMYDGPGSGPMLAAAAAWDGLATELQSAATTYTSVISELTAGSWLGASSAAMTSAAAPYLTWLRSTAAQAEQTASQAKAAAAAYEVTFAAMIPPPVIAANRALLQALVSTNVFGQNSPAIAFTETLYAEMWAQDAAAMYGYASASASATALTPFSPAPQTTSGTPAAQTSAQAAAAQTPVTAVQGLASTAAAAAAPATPLDTLSGFEGNLLFLPSIAQAALTPLDTTSEFVDLSYDDSELQDEATRNTEQLILEALTQNGFSVPTDVAVATAPVPAAGFAEASSVTADLGRAPTVGPLSVPPAWATAAPEIRLAAVTLPATSLGAAPQVMAASPGSLFSEMTLANMASRAIGGTSTPGRRQDRIASFAGARPVPANPEPATGPLTAKAADIHQLAEALVKLGDLRDAGLLTDEEFSKEKERLLAR